MNFRHRIQFKPGEKIIYRPKFHWMWFMPTALKMLVVFFVLFLLRFFLINSLNGAIFLVVIIGTVISLGFIRWYVVNMSHFLITNRRVISSLQKGVINLETTEFHYDKIKNVTSSIKGVMPTIFNYGSIQIHTTDSEGVLKVRFLKNPMKIQDIILECQQSYIRSPTQLLEKNSQEPATRNSDLSTLFDLLKLIKLTPELEKNKKYFSPTVEKGRVSAIVRILASDPEFKSSIFREIAKIKN